MEGEYVVAAIAVLFGWDVAQLKCPIRSCDTVIAVADVLLGEVAEDLQAHRWDISCCFIWSPFCISMTSRTLAIVHIVTM